MADFVAQTIPTERNRMRFEPKRNLYQPRRKFEASGLSLRSPQSGKRVREPPDSSWKYRTAFLIPKSVTSASASNGTPDALPGKPTRIHSRPTPQLRRAL